MLIGPIVLLAISIYQRIDQYGFTVWRYITILIMIWALLSLLYILIRKTLTIRFSISSLAILFILSSFGPWRAFSISGYSQANKFKNILLKYDSLKNGKIEIGNSNLTFEDKKTISSIVEYLISINQHKYIQKYFPKNNSIFKIKKNNTESSIFIAEKVFKEIGGSYISKWDKSEEKSINFYSDIENFKKAINIENYKFLYAFDFHSRNFDKEVNFRNKDYSKLSLNKKNRSIDISINGKELIKIPMKEIIDLVKNKPKIPSKIPMDGILDLTKDKRKMPVKIEKTFSNNKILLFLEDINIEGVYIERIRGVIFIG